MATTKNAIKQLEKAGAKVTDAGNRKYVAQMKAARIEVTDQDGEAIILYVIRNGYADNYVDDYFAGHFCKNTRQAIELAQRMETW